MDSISTSLQNNTQTVDQKNVSQHVGSRADVFHVLKMSQDT